MFPAPQKSALWFHASDRLASALRRAGYAILRPSQLAYCAAGVRLLVLSAIDEGGRKASYFYLDVQTGTGDSASVKLVAAKRPIELEPWSLDPIPASALAQGAQIFLAKTAASVTTRESILIPNLQRDASARWRWSHAAKLAS